MFIDCSKLPNPLAPLADDVFVTAGGARTIVMVTTAGQSDESSLTSWISYYLDGVHHTMPRNQLPAMLTSAGARPWGRLDRSDATRPEITRDPELVAQRLQAIGPHLRALREQYGLSMGNLARALGCPPARLSMLELGEPDPVRESAGVHEDEGRAALAEVLAESVANTFITLRKDGLEPVRPNVWESIHRALATGAAHAAMSTMFKARGEAEQASVNDINAVFRPGDRVRWVGRFARVLEADIDHLNVEFQDNGERCGITASGAELMNENAAIDAARAGLSLHLARVVAQSMDPRSPAEIERSDEQRELQSTIEMALATDEAQRLIRLHG